MNISREFLARFEALKNLRGTGTKKIVIGIATGIVVILTAMFMMSSLEVEPDPTSRRINIMPKKRSPQTNLNYDFITVDTIAIPTFPRADLPEQRPFEQPPVAEKPEPEKKKPVTTKRRTTPKTTTPQVRTNTAPRTTNRYPTTAGQAPSSMIVVNKIQQNPVQQAPRGSVLGRDATLVKVVLHRANHASNGSIVEARILNDTKWGNVKIPRRSKIIGVASLFNGRVNVDFQQIVINDSTRSCSGQAYDLKRQRGLPYSRVSSDAEEIALQELQSATAGIPVVSSVTAQVNRSSNITQETTTLDEGLEFYAWINSIL